MVNVSGVLVSVLISLTSVPLVLLVSNHDLFSQPIYLMTIGLGLLAVVGVLFMTFLSPSGIKSTKSVEGRGLLYYTCCVFMWGCVADFTIQTCHVNIFSCGENSYLAHGEPYLQTPFGITTQFWNAIVHYFLQLLVIYQIDNYQDCRVITLYWCGSIITSQFVLLVGGLSGSFSDKLEYAVWLNVIFVGLPVWILCRFLSKPMTKPNLPASKAIFNFYDVSVYILLLCAMFYNLLRGLGALGSKFPLVLSYVDRFEPYIMEPAHFGCCWVLYTAVYLIPFYFSTLYNFNEPVSQWAVNLSVFFSAGALQGTFTYLSYSWYPSSNPKYRIPEESLSIVLAVNIMLVVTAHMLMYRYLAKWGYFTTQLKKPVESRKKKK